MIFRHAMNFYWGAMFMLYLQAEQIGWAITCAVAAVIFSGISLWCERLRRRIEALESQKQV